MLKEKDKRRRVRKNGIKRNQNCGILDCKILLLVALTEEKVPYLAGYGNKLLHFNHINPMLL